MDQAKLSTEEIIAYYKDDLNKLLVYLPYFAGKRAKDVSGQFDGESMGLGNHTLQFPVYDSTLLAFVKVANQTVFMDQNYRYVYSRIGIRNHDDERKVIANCTLKEMDVLGGILSKYVLGGMTKGAVWTEGVEEEIYYRVIEKARDLIAFWDNKPKA